MHVLVHTVSRNSRVSACAELPDRHVGARAAQRLGQRHMRPRGEDAAHPDESLVRRQGERMFTRTRNSYPPTLPLRCAAPRRATPALVLAFAPLVVSSSPLLFSAFRLRM